MRYRILIPTQDDPSVMLELDAVPLGDGRFRLVGAAPTDKRMIFGRGEIVACEISPLPNGLHGLVATHSLSSDPEFRRRRTIHGVLGAIVGSLAGAAAALQVFPAQLSLAIGASLGAIVFAYCSVRWGDVAWKVLARHFP